MNFPVGICNFLAGKVNFPVGICNFLARKMNFLVRILHFLTGKCIFRSGSFVFQREIYLPDRMNTSKGRKLFFRHSLEPGF